MIGEVLSFGYDQCAKLGYAMGFGAMEGLVIYLIWEVLNTLVE